MPKKTLIYRFRHNVSGPWLNLFVFVPPEGWSLSKVFSSSLPLFISLSQFEWRGLRVTNFSFAVPEPHLHRSTCSLTCLYLRASARSKRIPANEAYIICRGPHDRARVFLKMAPAWSSTPTSQMAIRVDIWNNALYWQTSLPACPRLTSRGGHQFRLFSSGRMVVGLPAPDSETPPPPPPEPPG